MQPTDNKNQNHHPLLNKMEQSTLPKVTNSRFRHFSGFYNFLNTHSKQVLGASILLSGAILGVTLIATSNLDTRNKAFSGFETVGLGTVDFATGNFQKLGSLATPVIPEGKIETIKNLYYDLAETYKNANTIIVDESGAQITASSLYNPESNKTVIFIRTVNLPAFDNLLLRSYLTNKDTGEETAHSVAEFHEEDSRTVAYIATETPGNLTADFTGVTLSYDTPDSDGPVVIMLELTF